MKVLLCLALLLLNHQLANAQDVTKDQINGIWEMNGYGRIIDISESEVNTYDVTKVSCILNSKYKRND